MEQGKSTDTLCPNFFAEMGLNEGWEGGLIADIKAGSVKLGRGTRSTTATT